MENNNSKLTALTNFRFMANAVVTIEEAVNSLSNGN